VKAGAGRKSRDPYAVNLAGGGRAVRRLGGCQDRRPGGERTAETSRTRGVSAHASRSPPRNLAAPGVELWFGKIEAMPRSTVNGQRIGGGSDPRAATVFDVKTLLASRREHDRRCACGLMVTRGGVNKGVRVRLVDNPPPVAWSRSVFNGLAQVIVQSSREAGAIKLTARAGD